MKHMGRGVIRLNDTDHGGQVISVSSGTIVMGTEAALADDVTFCPKVRDGITDDMGLIAVEHKAGPADYRVELSNGEIYALAAVPQPALAQAPSHREQALSNMGARAIDGSTDSREHL